jgi:hypothetical protein
VLGGVVDHRHGRVRRQALSPAVQVPVEQGVADHHQGKRHRPTRMASAVAAVATPAYTSRVLPAIRSQP